MKAGNEIYDAANGRLSRRSFLKGTSLAATAAATATLGATQAFAAEEEAATTTPGITWANIADNAVWALDEIPEPSETQDADLVIVGGGGSGMFAALEAQQNGLEPVVLEKTPALGGSFVGCEGVFAINSPLQQEEGLEYNQQELIDEVLAFQQNNIDPRVLSRFVAHTGENIAWMEEQGVPFARVINGHCPTRVLWHIPDAGDHGTKTGLAMNEHVREAVDAAGIEVQVETPAKRILLDEEGKVAGLLAQRADGSVVQYNTKAVILASGGYSASEEFMEYFADIRPGTWFTYSPAANHGDGLRLGHDAGALMWRFPATLMGGVTTTAFGFGTFGFSTSTQEYYLRVNDKGERFADNIPQVGNAWNIFSQEAVDELEFGSGCLFGNGVFSTTGEPMEGLTELWEETVDDEKLFKADTLEELAEKLGIDPAALVTTVDRYNGFCEQGVDEDFFKNPATLLPLKTGPFWAFQAQRCCFFTVGGMRVDTENRVLDREQNPILGLYAVGSDAGGLYAQSYDINLMPGSQGAWAIYSGRNAAQAVGEYLKV